MRAITEGHYYSDPHEIVFPQVNSCLCPVLVCQSWLLGYTLIGAHCSDPGENDVPGNLARDPHWKTAKTLVHRLLLTAKWWLRGTMVQGYLLGQTGCWLQGLTLYPTYFRTHIRDKFANLPITAWDSDNALGATAVDIRVRVTGGVNPVTIDWRQSTPAGAWNVPHPGDFVAL